MADTWKPLGKKWTLAEAQKISPFSIYRMSLPEKAELAQFYYRQFNLRVETYARAQVVPYAFTKLMEDLNHPSGARLTDDQKAITLESPVVKTKGHKRQLTGSFADMNNPNSALNHYVTRMQSFFGSKTSTVSGWKEVGYQQDVKLFGQNAEQYRKYTYVMKDGKRKRVELQGPFFKVTPKHRMTDAERGRFWAIVDMAKQAGWLNRFGYSSEQAHRQIASLWMRGELDHDDIDAAYNRIQEILDDKAELRNKFPDEINGEMDSPFVRNGEGDVYEYPERSDLLDEYDSLLQ